MPLIRAETQRQVATALLCCFPDLARFTTDYRTQYGSTPTETLRS